MFWKAKPKVDSPSLPEALVSEMLGVLAEVMLAPRAVRGLDEGLGETDEGGNAESLSEVSEDGLVFCCWD